MPDLRRVGWPVIVDEPGRQPSCPAGRDDPPHEGVADHLQVGDGDQRGRRYAIAHRPAEVRNVVTALANQLGHDPNQLLNAAVDAPNLAALQRQLDIPVRELNATLSSLGGRYPVIDYSQGHAEEFSDHLRRLRDGLLDRLRWARWDRFAALDLQPDWLQLRRVESIGPDPHWGTTVDKLSSGLMDARIEEGLAQLLGAVPPTSGRPLLRLSDCARANAELVDSTASRLVKLVRAWLVRQGLPIEEPWANEEVAGGEVLAALDAAGALDFQKLTLPEMLRWLHVVGIWPADMPATDDRAALGITVDDLDHQKAEAQRLRAERARQQRIVLIDDQPFDLEDGYSALRETLTQALEKTPGFLATRRRFTSLREIDAPSGGGGRAGSGASASGRRPELSSQQKLAVGFAGEWLAYQWLAHQYGADFTQECWVSTYREQLFPGGGDDGQGWDFEVPVRNGKHYYEVKTTVGEGGQVELGETQVLAAQESARNRQWRLLVITNALNKNRRIHMLRNPFDPASRGRYSFVGQGLQLRYVVD